MRDREPRQWLSRQPPCPVCDPHEWHHFFGCEQCDCPPQTHPYGTWED